MISCKLDAKDWPHSLKSVMNGKLLPIIVSANREGDETPSQTQLMQELAVARNSAQKLHERCQQLEKLVAEKEQKFAGRANYAAYSRAVTQVRVECREEFDRKLAAYKDATRSEMRSIRRSSLPGVYVAFHVDEKANVSDPCFVLSYHEPGEVELREVCGFPETGTIRHRPLVVPLIAPKTK